MKLTEAIERNKVMKELCILPANELAIQLGIEALEREQLLRQRLTEFHLVEDIRLLPSEE